MAPRNYFNGLPPKRNPDEGSRAEAARRLMREPKRLSPMEADARSKAAEMLLNAIPKELANQQPTVIQSKLTEVSVMVEEFNAEVRRLASKYGVHGAPLRIDQRAQRNAEILSGGRAASGSVLRACLEEAYMPKEFLQITRVGDQGWGVYYKVEAAPFAPDRQNQTPVQLITGCRVEVKKIFLRRSAELFQQYVKHVTEVVGQADADLATGAEVLRALKEAK